MKPPPTFRLLFRIFLNRFFENDTVSPEAGFETNIWQVLGFFVSTGLFAALFLIPSFVQISLHQPRSPVVHQLRLLFSSASFAIVGFTTLFEWDMLFPDRRDFLVLTPFPIRLRELCAAKFCALGAFLILLIASLNIFPMAMAALISFSIAGFSGLTARFLLGHLAANVSAAAFAFLVVAALQGVLSVLVSPRFFRSLSPWIQTIGMSLMVLLLITIPIYSTQPAWQRFIPTVWFSGVYDAGGLKPALDAVCIVFGIFCLTWLAGFGRHYRRTLETEDTASHSPGFHLFDRLPGTVEERAIFRFSGQTLSRSAKHRLFLATYWSAGLSIGLLLAVSVVGGRLGVSTEGLRAVPFLIGLFVVSGFRATFQFPADLSSNWIFRITQSFWSETARRASRKRLLVSGLLPAILLFFPVGIWQWGPRSGAIHSLFQLAAGAILTEFFFWSFDKVPFTCSYDPGKMDFAFLAGLFVYGVTGYSFQAANLEAYVDGHPARTVLFFVFAATALALLWRRRVPPADVSFDREPTVQTLGLT